MNAYDVKVNELKESLEIKDHKEILKLKLVSEFLKITSDMDSDEILEITKLHKSDLSRLRSMNVGRFTIDRLIGILTTLGYTTRLTVEEKEAS